MARLDLVPLNDTLIGEKYRLGPVLGSGGVATVYRATHLWTEREVAVKLLDPTLPHFDRVRQAFLKEARATVQLKHPNVVDVLDMGEDDWETVYMVMELLHGPTLRDVLNERGRLSQRETLEVLLPLIDALEKANEMGIVHRDFKPENIVLTYDVNGVMTPKLLDFGIAEILQDARSQGFAGSGDVIMGTPQYMAPEQACDDREGLGPHTDVWGVGVVWYECLAGQVPFVADSVEETLRAVCGDRIDFTPIPQGHVPLLREALRQPPEQRIRSFAELKARIRNLGLADFSAPQKAPIPSYSRSVELDPGLSQGTLIGLPASEPPPVVHSAMRPVARPKALQLSDAEFPEDLPVRPSRKAKLAAVSVALALALGAWWLVRGPAEEPSRVAEPAIAEPKPEPRQAEATLALTLPAASEEAAADVVAESPARSDTEVPANTDAEARVKAGGEPAELSERVDEVAVAPKPMAAKPAKRRKSRRKKPAPEPQQKSASSDGLQYRKPPELVGEW